MSDRFLPSDFGGILSRITPEDGAEWVRRNDEGLTVEFGPLRDDWLEICERAAAQAMAAAPEIRARVKREYGDSSRLREIGSEAVLREAIRIRDTLLSEPRG